MDKLIDLICDPEFRTLLMDVLVEIIERLYFVRVNPKQFILCLLPIMRQVLELITYWILRIIYQKVKTCAQSLFEEDVYQTPITHTLCWICSEIKCCLQQVLERVRAVFRKGTAHQAFIGSRQITCLQRCQQLRLNIEAVLQTSTSREEQMNKVNKCVIYSAVKKLVYPIKKVLFFVTTPIKLI